MSSENDVASVYRLIIDDVIRNSRAIFANNGVDESVLYELQQVWESRLTQSQISAAHQIQQQQQQLILGNPGNRQSNNQKMTERHQQQMPQLQGVVKPEFPIAHEGFDDSAYSVANLPQLATMKSGYSGHTITLDQQSQSQRLPTLLSTSTSLSSASAILPSRNDNNNPGNNEKIASNRGNHKSDMDDVLAAFGTASSSSSSSSQQQKVSSATRRKNSAVNGDETKVQSTNAQQASNTKPKPLNNTIITASTQNGGDETNSIGSDLDESEDESDDEGDQGNLILCQYEKVSRVKNKYRCNFKEGIIRVNNRDVLFHKATGEFDW